MVYIKKFLKSFSQAQQGAVAIIVAICLVAVLFGVLSLSIDLNRTQTSYTHNYNATDAAALAGAEMWLQGKIDAIGKQPEPLDFAPSNDSMTEYAKNVLIENFDRDQDSSIFLDDSTFKVTMGDNRQANGKIRYTVTVTACAQLDTPISSVPKHNQDAENPGKAKTCTSSTAGFDLGKLENAEVAFALDFTESMYWRGANQGCPADGNNPECPIFEDTKAYALQQAMDYVFNEYFDSSDEATAYASIVPYTSFVNIYPYDERGVTNQRADAMSFDGKTFLSSDYDNPANAFSIYRARKMDKTRGRDLRSFELDPDFHKTVNIAGKDYKFVGYAPFFTSKGAGHDPVYETENYSYIFNRVPALDEDKLEDVIDNPDNISFLPFPNYHDLVDYISDESFVTDPTIHFYNSWDKVAPIDPNEQFAKMICGQYTLAAAADERIDGELIANEYEKFYNGNGHDIELHESFPIQPLTKDIAVLNTVLERYVSDQKLFPGKWAGFDDQIVDFQGKRIDKARLASINHKTSSIHGLMWAWFTINNAWKDIWNAEISVTEKYVGGNKSARDGTDGEELPSEKNFKHIVLISDGFDNDGCKDISGGTGGEETGIDMGRLNACDAYAPIRPITDKQYDDLCTAIKTNGTSDNNDDTTIHIVTLDFDASNGEVTDGICNKAGGENNRFAKCATTGEYYNNVTPDKLREMFDDIFAGILTKAIPVRLIK